MFPAESVQIASTDRFATRELVEKGAVSWVHSFWNANRRIENRTAPKMAHLRWKTPSMTIFRWYILKKGVIGMYLIMLR